MNFPPATVSKLAGLSVLCTREIGQDHGLYPHAEKGDRVVGRRQVPECADTTNGGWERLRIVPAPALFPKIKLAGTFGDGYPKCITAFA